MIYLLIYPMQRVGFIIAGECMPLVDQTPIHDTLPPWRWPRAAYIHIPFCAHRCGYCDFAIAVGQDDLIEKYLDALSAEMKTLGRPEPVETLFLGGGTPTHLSRASSRGYCRTCLSGCR